MRSVLRSAVPSLAAILIAGAALMGADWLVQGTLLQDLAGLSDVVAVFSALTLTERLFDAVQARLSPSHNSDHA